jgi:hypothetical protein
VGLTERRRQKGNAITCGKVLARLNRTGSGHSRSATEKQFLSGCMNRPLKRGGHCNFSVCRGLLCEASLNIAPSVCVGPHHMINFLWRGQSTAILASMEEFRCVGGRMKKYRLTRPIYSAGQVETMNTWYVFPSPTSLKTLIIEAMQTTSTHSVASQENALNFLSAHVFSLLEPNTSHARRDFGCATGYPESAQNPRTASTSTVDISCRRASSAPSA